MVGHNPGVEQMLLNSVHPERAASTMRMGTGTLAVMEFTDGFKQRTPAGSVLNLLEQAHFCPT